MTKKRMLADVLWEAATLRLWDGTDPNPRDGCEWSCNAALAAEMGPRFYHVYAMGHIEEMRASSPAMKLLSSLGADPHVAASIQAKSDEQRQGIRYMWLLLAMHVADDEGIEI